MHLRTAVSSIRWVARVCLAASVIPIGVGACTVFDTSSLTEGRAAVAAPPRDGSIGSADQGSDLPPIDAGVRLDSSVIDSSQPRLDAAMRGYCDDWTLCDTFDGDRSISTWQVVVNGPGGSIARSTVRASSGTHSLRAQRSAGNSDYALWKIEDVIKECEFDTFVVDTFAATTPELQVAFFGINATGFALVEPLEAIFRNDGVLGRWFAEQSLGTSVGGGSTATFNLQPTRNRWIHVAMRLSSNAGEATASTLAVGLTPESMEPRTLSLLPTKYPFSKVTFGVGVAYEVTARIAVDVFVDNVRCR